MRRHRHGRAQAEEAGAGAHCVCNQLYRLMSSSRTGEGARVPVRVGIAPTFLSTLCERSPDGHFDPAAHQKCNRDSGIQASRNRPPTLHRVGGMRGHVIEGQMTGWAQGRTQQNRGGAQGVCEGVVGRQTVQPRIKLQER